MEAGIIEYITGRKGNNTAIVREVEYVNITVATIHSGFTGYTKSVQEVSYVTELAHESPAFNTVPAILGMIESAKSFLIAASIISTATEVAKDSSAAFASYATDLANEMPAFDPIPAIEGLIESAKSSHSSAALSLYATELQAVFISTQKNMFEVSFDKECFTFNVVLCLFTNCFIQCFFLKTAYGNWCSHYLGCCFLSPVLNSKESTHCRLCEEGHIRRKC